MRQFHSVLKWSSMPFLSFCPANSDVTLWSQGGLYNYIQVRRWGEEVLSLLSPIYLLSQRKLCQGTTQKNTLYISLARTRSHINWSMSTLDQSLAKGSGMSMTGLIRIIPRHMHTHTLGRALRLLEQRISFPLPPTWTIWGGRGGGRPVSSQEENNYLLCAQNQCQSQYLNSHWWMTLKSHQNWSSYHKAYIMSFSMLKTAEYPYCAYDSGESSDLRLESEEWLLISYVGKSVYFLGPQFSHW